MSVILSGELPANMCLGTHRQAFRRVFQKICSPEYASRKRGFLREMDATKISARKWLNCLSKLILDSSLSKGLGSAVLREIGPYPRKSSKRTCSLTEQTSTPCQPEGCASYLIPAPRRGRIINPLLITTKRTLSELVACLRHS